MFKYIVFYLPKLKFVIQHYWILSKIYERSYVRSLFLNNEIIHLDFEKGCSLCYAKDVYLEVKVKRYRFHFGQSLQPKM